GANFLGRAYVYYGGTSADAGADLTFTGALASDELGNAVAGAKDVNADGYADVVVGASAADGVVIDAGRAYVFEGGPGAGATPASVFSGEATGDEFGYAVASAGDLNRDGFSDLVIGAPLNSHNGSRAGRVYIYDMNRYHVLAPALADVWNVGANQTISWLGA